MTTEAWILIVAVGVAVVGILSYRIIGLGANRLLNHVDIPKSQQRDESAPPTKETDENEWIP